MTGDSEQEARDRHSQAGEREAEPQALLQGSGFLEVFFLGFLRGFYKGLGLRVREGSFKGFLEGYYEHRYGRAFSEGCPGALVNVSLGGLDEIYDVDHG